MIGILFDLDGTLLDTLEDLMDGVNYALRQFHYPERSREEVRCFVGNGAARLMEKAVPEGKDWKPVFDCFQVYYREHCRVKTQPYPGILEALAELGKTYPLGIVSNKPDAAAKALCAEYFPGVYARGESPDCPRKPAPDMVHMAMQSMGLDRCIYVGDSEVDVLTAVNAGVPCLSVLWGFRKESEIRPAGKSDFCSTPAELPAAIAAIAAREGNKHGQ